MLSKMVLKKQGCVSGVQQSDSVIHIHVSMTNLDSIFRSRDITLPTKVHPSMVFPVVMYGCESWTVKKAEH